MFAGNMYKNTFINTFIGFYVNGALCIVIVKSWSTSIIKFSKVGKPSNRQGWLTFFLDLSLSSVYNIQHVH